MHSGGGGHFFVDAAHAAALDAPVEVLRHTAGSTVSKTSAQIGVVGEEIDGGGKGAGEVVLSGRCDPNPAAVGDDLGRPAVVAGYAGQHVPECLK